MVRPVMRACVHVRVSMLLALLTDKCVKLCAVAVRPHVMFLRIQRHAHVVDVAWFPCRCVATIAVPSREHQVVPFDVVKHSLIITF